MTEPVILQTPRLRVECGAYKKAPHCANSRGHGTERQVSMQDNTIPRGYCQCGCGERTQPYKGHQPSRGMIRGQLARYIAGHQLRRPNNYRVEDHGFLTPCWIWQGAITPKGYGRMHVLGQKVKVIAHRRYYEQTIGPVPAGYELDHLCRVAACVNPEHLEPVPPGVNQQRGWDARKAGAPTQQGFLDPRLTGESYGTAGTAHVGRSRSQADAGKSCTEAKWCPENISHPD